jgi:hypothetical protein
MMMNNGNEGLMTKTTIMKVMMMKMLVKMIKIIL